MLLLRLPVAAVSLIAFAGVHAQPPAPKFACKGHSDAVYSVAVSPDGKMLATGSFDKSIKLWDATTGTELRTLAGKNGHTNLVLGVAFAPDGSALASVSTDNTLKIWNVGPAPVWSAILGATAGNAKLQTDSPAYNLVHPNIVHCAAFDKTGKLVATGCQDGILRIYDVSKAPGAVAKAINAHILPQGQSIYCVAWHPEGKLIATGSLDQSIKIWDATTGLLVKGIEPGTDAVIIPEGVRTALPGLYGATAGHLVNAPPSRGHRDQVFTLVFSKDGKQLLSGSSDHTLKLWKTDTGELIREFSNPDLKPSGEGNPPPAHPGFVQAAKFTADGTKIVSVGNAPKLRGYLAVWNIADGKRLHGEELDFGAINAVDLLADGSLILACGPRQRGVSDADAVALSVK